MPSKEFSACQLTSAISWEEQRETFFRACRNDKRAADAASRAEAYRLKLRLIESQAND